jgi:hypothetical protein
MVDGVELAPPTAHAFDELDIATPYRGAVTTGSTEAA